MVLSIFRRRTALACILYVAAVASACSSKNNNSGSDASSGGDSNSTISGAEAAYVHVNGRVDSSYPGGVLLAWPGTSLTVRVTGASRVIATLYPSQRGQNNVVSAVVDGNTTTTTKLGSVKYNFVVTVPTGDHTVTFYKHTEGGNGGVLVNSFTTDGQFEKIVQEPARLIEIVGENAVAGGSADGPLATPSGTTCSQPINSVSDPNIQNAYNTFGPIVARSFGADYSIIAASNRGVYQNYDGSNGGTIPELYNFANPIDYNSSWKPSKTADVVVINLGVNDVNYWLYNSNGVSANTDGFVASYVTLIKKIRALNPSAYIIATVGPVLSNYQCINSTLTTKACTGASSELPLLSTVESMVKKAITQSGDSKASFYSFTPDSTNVSCNYLPDANGHQAMAKQLTSVVESLTGWQTNPEAVTQPEAAASGTGPKTLTLTTTTWQDPLAAGGDPNVTGVNNQQFPQCHYCSPQLYDTTVSCTSTYGIVGISQPCEGYCHVPEGFNEVHFSNPPVSGNHYATPEATVGEHTTATIRGRIIHSMEHGAIILSYNCPDGCDSDLAVLRSVIAAYPNNGNTTDPWIIMTPDPLLTETKFAALSWTWKYLFDSADLGKLSCFVDQHKFYGRECLTGHNRSACPALLDKPMSSTE